MKKALIFDLDGTLWDSSENVASSWTEAVRKAGYVRKDITRSDIMAVMGLTMDAIADIIFADLTANEKTKLLKNCCDYENEYLEKHGGVLYEKLEETFIKLKEDYRLYIVSNCQKGYIEAFLKYNKFEKYFDDIECYGNNLKNKGENIALIIRRNNINKAVYIGDIEGDYKATMLAKDILLKDGNEELSFIHAAYGFGTISEKVPALKKFYELPELLLN